MARKSSKSGQAFPGPELGRLLSEMAASLDGLADRSEERPPLPLMQEQVAGFLNRFVAFRGEFRQLFLPLAWWPISAGIGHDALRQLLITTYHTMFELFELLIRADRGKPSYDASGAGAEADRRGSIRTDALHLKRCATAVASLRRCDTALGDSVRQLGRGESAWLDEAWTPVDPAAADKSFRAADAEIQARLNPDHGWSVIDGIHLGGDRWIEVTGLSCKIICGATPSVCPHASPVLPPTLLESAEIAVRRIYDFPKDMSIHWVGHDAGYRGLCQCHPDASYPPEYVRHAAGRPVWERQKRTLSFRGQVIRDFSKKEAFAQEAILDSFQEEGWRPTITFSRADIDIRETIKSFNRMVRRNTIRLVRDGTGNGVRWQISDNPG